jgi:Prenyltransferase and squalene oxidase repeat
MVSSSRTAALLFASLLCLAYGAGTARADGVPQEYRATVAKGLAWLVKNQNKDGHWEAQGGQYPVSMTGLAGMALLMEGSTIREGKYQDNIRRAVDYLMTRSQPNGLLGNLNSPGESGRYLFGHGYALLFLSTIYGDEEDVDRRKKLEDILTRAAKFSREAQTRHASKQGNQVALGGWGYIAAKEGNNFAEGSVTVIQMQALRAARNAGIAVPAEAIKEGLAYLQESTNPQGGVVYSLATGGDARPAITGAAISCAFGVRDFDSPMAKKWLKFTQAHTPVGSRLARQGYDEFTHYYLAQVVYQLGDDGYAKLFPDARETDILTWSKYRKATFEPLVKSQAADGSWAGTTVGPLYTTASFLCILQLDNGVLPLYQRR